MVKRRFFKSKESQPIVAEKARLRSRRNYMIQREKVLKSVELAIQQRADSSALAELLVTQLKPKGE